MTLTTFCNTTGSRSAAKSPRPPAKREAQPPLQSVSLLLDRSLRSNPNKPPKLRWDGKSNSAAFDFSNAAFKSIQTRQLWLRRTR